VKIKPFVPDHAEDLSYNKICRSKGSLLFIDITGFTALSEKMSDYGKKGTEELTEILNSFFGRCFQ